MSHPHDMYVINTYSMLICIILHKNDVIISLSDFTEPFACGSVAFFNSLTMIDLNGIFSISVSVKRYIFLKGLSHFMI